MFGFGSGLFKKNEANNTNGASLDSVGKTNFYTVKNYIESGENLVNSLRASGYQLNVPYKLDYGSKTFMMIDSSNLDNVCLNSEQNYMFDIYDSNNKVTLLIGDIDISTVSIGELFYLKGFGAVLIKTDRPPEKYVNELGFQLSHQYQFNVNFPKISLNRSFIKIAFKNAVCINISGNIETDADIKALREASNDEMNILKGFLSKARVKR